MCYSTPKKLGVQINLADFGDFFSDAKHIWCTVCLLRIGLRATLSVPYLPRVGHCRFHSKNKTKQKKNTIVGFIPSTLICNEVFKKKKTLSTFPFLSSPLHQVPISSFLFASRFPLDFSLFLAVFFFFFFFFFLWFFFFVHPTLQTKMNLKVCFCVSCFFVLFFLWCILFVFCIPPFFLSHERFFKKIFFFCWAREWLCITCILEMYFTYFFLKKFFVPFQDYLR